MTLIIEEGGSQSADMPKRHHAANSLVKKFPSLQVSQYPVLLFSNTDTEEQPAPVVCKASSNSETREFEDAGGDGRAWSKPPPLSPCSSSHLRSHPSFSSIVSATMKNQPSKNTAIHSPFICFTLERSTSTTSASSSQSTPLATHREVACIANLKIVIPIESTAMPTPLLRQMYSLDERGSFRQQRKRRAGMSGVASIGSALGGRSPHSSFDSNTDVAQISMNWMRMNGLGQGGFRQLLSGNPAVAKSVPPFDLLFQSTTNLGRVSSFRKTHGISSPEDRVPAQPHIEIIDALPKPPYIHLTKDS
ncbi:hypothetical protein GCK32_002996 [Trichostrongylus colubriformis]|uniref:Uncharacterized protein n=1 Tax=Trichostrongylus colubriformis TaxID=6319 RepID=A0AAN8FJF8_TRICO